MRSQTCAVWPGARGLIAVMVDCDGQRATPVIAPADTEEACWTLLTDIEATSGLDWELVLPDRLARSRTSGLARLASVRGIPVWVVPAPIVDALVLVANLSRRPPASTATVLARLPLVPYFRAALRRVQPLDPRQTSLL